MTIKTDVPGIYKEGDGVLINKDNSALRAYKLQKRQLHKNIELEEEVKTMKNDLAEIKELLKGLVK
jgi:hypothetical protein